MVIALSGIIALIHVTVLYHKVTALSDKVYDVINHNLHGLHLGGRYLVQFYISVPVNQHAGQVGIHLVSNHLTRVQELRQALHDAGREHKTTRTSCRECQYA